ncbi:phage Gp37/Gp68 family protein [Catenulispora yoronensis]|uniref:Phage Gp37/Gp68 family protein n=1 Tax=Catenulispora yoronensis TaxID=450799 RepID=A0ABP5G091_9ACTN
MNTTTIEWTDRTWNPVTGCTRVSPGCDRCYAENIARRFAGGAAFPNGFAVTLHPERLDAPRRWRRPARVFVNSMSDLFHNDIPDEFVLAVFQTMADTPQHTFQILTKRPARMRAFCDRLGFRDPTRAEAAAGHLSIAYLEDHPADVAPWDAWPLPNVWLGVSVEDQARAELRIPALLRTNAAMRFISAEPLIGPLDLETWFKHVQTPACDRCSVKGALDWHSGHLWGRCDCTCHPGSRPNRLDWVIIGGESGPGARPMDLTWARNLIELGRVAGFAVFMKQLGTAWARRHDWCRSPKGADMEDWPERLRVRQMPAQAASAIGSAR